MDALGDGYVYIGIVALLITRMVMAVTGFLFFGGGWWWWVIFAPLVLLILYIDFEYTR